MLIDSNIFIYSLSNSSSKQLIAQNFLQTGHTKKFIAQQNIFETLRIITHSRFPDPFTTEEASHAIEDIIEPFSVISPNDLTWRIALDLISKYQITGLEIFDAYLVATALSNEIYTIATDNVKHLGIYKEVKIFNPF